MSRLSAIWEEGTRKLQDLIEKVPQVDGFEIHSEGSGSSWRMEDVSDDNQARLQEVSAVDSDDPMSLLKVVLDEYRNLLAHLPSGMLVAPAFHTLLEWHGSVHITDGFYKGGVFKFVMNIPIDYPAAPPSVYFFNQIFHPLVDPDTGRLDLSPAFPTWKPGRDYLVLVLSFLKKIFFKRELNSHLVTMPKELFLAKCEECVAESLRLIYVCHPNCPAPFAPWRKQVTSLMGQPKVITPYDQIDAAIKQLPAEATLEERAEMLNEWILSDLLGDQEPIEDGVVIKHN